MNSMGVRLEQQLWLIDEDCWLRFIDSRVNMKRPFNSAKSSRAAG